MPKLQINKLIVIFFITFFLLFPKNVFSQVLINEFSASTTNDWVEIYNTGSPFDISSLVLIDGDGQQKIFPFCMLNTNGTYSIDFLNRLDNGGDKIGLIKDGLLIDCVSYRSGPVCEGRGVDLPDLGENEFGVRQPEGTGNWGRLTVSTKSNNSSCLTPTPSSTGTPTPLPETPSPTTTISPSLTPIPIPKATYKINKTKDNNGVELSNVEIYVNDVYIHHIDDQTLIFCPGCHCDDDHNIDCELGQHTIRLEKDGYNNWQETKTFNAGDSSEVNPVMAKVLPTPTPTSSPTPTVKITLTPSPTGTPKITPGTSLTTTPEIIASQQDTQTGNGEILGSGVFKEESTDEDLFPENYPDGYNVKSKITKYLFLIPIIAGILIILITGGSLIKSQIRKRSVI